MILCASLLLPCVPSLFAHGDLHDRILELTEKLKTAPDKITLYWQRAELHRLHEDWKLALADYDQVAELNPDFAGLDLGRAKAWLGGQQFAQAKPALDRFLSRFPQHPEGYLIRARVQRGLGKELLAAADYTKAIQSYSEPEPALYIERSQALAAAGPEHFDEAIRGLDEGTQRLGATSTLQVIAIDMEVKAKRYDEALLRLDQVAAKMPRKESWLLRRAEILEMAGRFVEARQAVADAFKAVEDLPEARRSTKSIAYLEQMLNQVLERLEKATPKKRS